MNPNTKYSTNNNYTVSESCLSQEWLWTLIVLLFLQRSMKIHEGTHLRGRKSTCSALSVVKWGKGWVHWFLSIAPISLSSKLGSLAKQGEQYCNSVLLPQLFPVDHLRATHKTEKAELSPLLRQRCVVLLWALCAFCQTAMGFWVFVELAKLYLLPLAEFGSILSTSVPDQILPGIPHWPLLAFAVSKTYSGLILMYLLQGVYNIESFPS